MTKGRDSYSILCCGWACSSVGQSVRLITGRSQVRALSGPPSFDNKRPSVSRVAAGALIKGDVAQLGERGLCKPEVVGSIPIVSTKCSSRVSARLFSYLAACRRSQDQRQVTTDVVTDGAGDEWREVLRPFGLRTNKDGFLFGLSQGVVVLGPIMRKYARIHVHYRRNREAYHGQTYYNLQHAHARRP